MPGRLGQKTEAGREGRVYLAATVPLPDDGCMLHCLLGPDGNVSGRTQTALHLEDGVNLGGVKPAAWGRKRGEEAVVVLFW